MSDAVYDIIYITRAIAELVMMWYIILACNFYIRRQK